jgi:hypothetical protein
VPRAGRTTHEVRAGDQPQDRQGPRPDDPAVAPAAGGSGDRVKAAGATGCYGHARQSPERSGPPPRGQPLGFYLSASMWSGVRAASSPSIVTSSQYTPGSATRNSIGPISHLPAS